MLIIPYSKLNSPAASKPMLPSTIKRPNKKKLIHSVVSRVLLEYLNLILFWEKKKSSNHQKLINLLRNQMWLKNLTTSTIQKL